MNKYVILGISIVFICKILFVINFVKILRDIKFFQLNKEC